MLLLLTLFTIFGCNKDKKTSNRLDGETWAITSITVETAEISSLPELNFSECNIYKESCTGKWILDDISADFFWQFREKGSLFEISNQSSISSIDEDAIMQCMNFSGVYNVVSSTKKALEITSENTVGYNGQQVDITLEKK